MSTNLNGLEALSSPTEAEARQKFAEATRQTSFSIALGVREIRMLAEKPWHAAWTMMGSELAALHRLIEKGLLTHTYGESPKLSAAGRTVRELLVLSRHIVPRHTVVSPLDVLDGIAYALKAVKTPAGFTEAYVVHNGKVTPDAAPDDRLILTGPHGEQWEIRAADVRRVG